MWLLIALGLAAAFRIFYPVLKARRDRALSGLLSLLTGAGCVGVAIVAERIEEHAMNLSTASHVATGVMVVLVVLALLAVIRGLADLVRVPFTKVSKAANNGKES